jgi:hypothetical protein
MDQYEYSDMTQKIQNLGITEVSLRRTLLHNGLLKHVSMAMNVHINGSKKEKRKGKKGKAIPLRGHEGP